MLITTSYSFCLFDELIVEEKILTGVVKFTILVINNVHDVHHYHILSLVLLVWE